MALSTEELDGEILVGCDLGFDPAVVFVDEFAGIEPLMKLPPSSRPKLTGWAIREGGLVMWGPEYYGLYILAPGEVAKMLFYCAWARYRKRRAAWRGRPNRLAYVCARTVTDALGAPEWYGRIGRAVALAALRVRSLRGSGSATGSTRGAK